MGAEELFSKQPSPSHLSAAPPSDWPTINAHRGECFHPGRSVAQADLFFLKPPYADWILKDFSARPCWIRPLTRKAFRDEVGTMEALAGIPGIPRLAGCLGDKAYVMERLRADRLPRKNEKNGLSLEFFDRAEALVAAMHARGWAHGDLRRKNILVDAEMRPYLIDFATAFHAGPDAGALRRWLFRRWVQVDITNLARIKESYFPEDLTPRDREILAARPAYMKVGRFFKKKVYRHIKRRNRRELWARIKAFFG